MSDRSIDHLPLDLRALTCRDVIDFLDLFIEGGLPEKHAENFRRHTEGCGPCREYLESYRQTLRLAALCAESDEPVAGRFPDHLLREILRARAK